MTKEVPVAALKSLYASHLKDAVHLAAQTKGWVVVLYPTRDLCHQGRLATIAMLPEGATSGGRTSLLPSGGKISVVSPEDDIDMGDNPFSMVFLGWGEAQTDAFRGVRAWREKALQVIDAA